MDVDPREGSQFFLNVPEKLNDPFPDLKYFRERRPIFHVPELNTWFIFRYDDVSRLFHDTRLSANRMAGFVDAAPEEFREELRQVAPYLEMFMLMKDGAEHSHIRSGMQLGLTPSVVQHLGERIQQSADELLDRVGAGNRLDACADYAFLLPAYVLSDLFGVRREDRDRIVNWSVAFIDFFNIIPITAATSRRMMQSAHEMLDYTRSLIAERQRDGQADFLGVLAGAGKLTPDEIAGNVMLLLLAGHVAVRNLIGNALWLLLTHPEQIALLKGDVGLMTGNVEETLRFEPPVIMIPRVARENFEFEGNAIRQGQIIQLHLASANRDEKHFSSPDRFDITRKPEKHLAFGSGPHGCFGAALAREIAHIALSTLLQRFPEIRLDESRTINWYRNAANRGPINLPLIW